MHRDFSQKKLIMSFLVWQSKEKNMAEKVYVKWSGLIGSNVNTNDDDDISIKRGHIYGWYDKRTSVCILMLKNTKQDNKLAEAYCSQNSI